MSNSDISKNSSVTLALRAFPKPVFIAWLQFRRRAGDSFTTMWRKAPADNHRVLWLDRAAAFCAVLN